MAYYGPQPVLINDRRHGPGFQVVRPASSPPIGSGDDAAVQSADWCVISQAAPNTAFFKPSIIQAFSNVEDAYEGASASFKTLLTFDPPLDPSKEYAVILSAEGAMVAGATFNGQLNSFVDTLGIGVNGRQRIITDEYDISDLTWNEFIATPPEMLGNTFNFGGSSANYVAGIFAFSGTADYSLYSTGGFEAFQISNDEDIYGVVLDVKPVYDCNSPADAGLLTIEANYQAPVLSTGGSHTQILVVTIE